MCSGLVAMKVWMRFLGAGSSASAARSMSARPARASEQTTLSLTFLAISLTARKSPSEAIAKPASITSTPICSSTSAIFSFSGTVIEAPGDCSPSRSVVSKMMMRSSSAARGAADGAATVLGGLADMDRFLSGGGWTLRCSRCPLNTRARAAAQGQLSRSSAERRLGAARRWPHAAIPRSPGALEACLAAWCMLASKDAGRAPPRAPWRARYKTNGARL